MARRGYEPKKYELQADQAAALDHLLGGKTVTEAAAAVGVARETVSRWRHHDPAFQAAYNAALQSAYEAGQARLLDARARALDRLATLLDSEDEATALKAAAALLRVPVVEPTGPVSPERVERLQVFDLI
jgi:transposase-like protein